ncbi:NAD-dependent DNA ligase LigA [Cardinium endosymbiont of Culicoides punctatus]|uniref:NAD-dependent DNA ligase LigA n=1 Tax=Cardinium endosymbiont of Culicoides punctatus TaxID=2304601 RepID=UPI0010584144|nr:NAD-dependent DNA ligase LigA [Cardinium endosymbiont of Culicoides punctatus]TDG94779.1 DNA ligase [Cardinium endosymbiont of Culicoides punctatus]
MHETEISKEMKRLADLIRYHNESYFQKNISEISDYAYDQLLEQLIQLEKRYPHYKLIDSPTEKLGELPSKSFPVAYHRIPMLSLAKTYSEEEVVQFIKRVKKILPNQTIDFVCEPKIDGVALSMIYEHNSLVRVATRGDGEKGDDITQNAKTLFKIPDVITDSQYTSFEVRGEAFMTKEFFETSNQERAKQGQELWANPRNITAGTLKTLDLNLLKEREIIFYAYSFYSQSIPCYTQQEALELLVKLGFSIAPTYKICHDITEIMDYIHSWSKRKNTLLVDIDGIVIKVNAFQQQQAIGITAKAPRWAIAYKYQPEIAHSTLENVTFQVGRTGAITPVAHFNPILLAGTMVRRASLHNADEIARQDLHLGDTVLIEKGGEIIPQVVGVDIKSRNQTSLPIVFTSVCPACSTSLIREMGEAVFYCPNKQACLPQLKGRILHFAHRKAMDIYSLGPKTVDALFEANLIKTVADLYKLRYEQVNQLEGFQEISTKKLLAHIKDSKSIPFNRVLFALGIKHVGETVAKKLAAYFGNMEQLQCATITDLLQVSDIGMKIAQSIIDHLNDPYQQTILTELKDAGLKFSFQKIEKFTKNLVLSSKKLVLSGTFQKYTREELSRLIEQAGGKLNAAVSSKIDYLVVGNSPGPSKVAKARTLGISVLEENDILNMIEP